MQTDLGLDLDLDLHIEWGLSSRSILKIFSFSDTQEFYLIT